MKYIVGYVLVVIQYLCKSLIILFLLKDFGFFFSCIFFLLVVATDDERIADCCRGFGAEVIMTSESCPNGKNTNNYFS